MADSVMNVLLGLLTSAIGAALGWLAQTLRRRRRLERTRAFFGLPGGTECLIVVNRSIGTNSSNRTITHLDAFALMELSAQVRACGAVAKVVVHDDVTPGYGEKTEFCLGGPVSNERMGVHLAHALPGVTVSVGPAINRIEVGSGSYDRDGDAVHYVLVARVATPEHGRPIFLFCGQTGIANQAGVRYLTGHHLPWVRKYGPEGTFALVLRVINPVRFGPDVVELVADVTAAATTRPAATPTAVGP